MRMDSNPFHRYFFEVEHPFSPCNSFFLHSTVIFSDACGMLLSNNMNQLQNSFTTVKLWFFLDSHYKVFFWCPLYNPARIWGKKVQSNPNLILAFLGWLTSCKFCKISGQWNICSGSFSLLFLLMFSLLQFLFNIFLKIKKTVLFDPTHYDISMC